MNKEDHKDPVPGPGNQGFQDLGFGTGIGFNNKGLLDQDGNFNIERRGGGLSSINPYILLVSIPWWQLLLIIFGIYICINAIFGLLYTTMPGQLTGMPEEGFLQQWSYGFYFSVHTFTTVGYGLISPVGTGAQMLASLEALVGLLSMALATGIMYGRFSKPKADIQFSKNALIAPYKDTDSLQFRIVNRRNNHLIELYAQVVLTWYEMVNGEAQQKYERLPLEREYVSLFPLNWTIVHPIREGSPFYGSTREKICSHNPEVLVMLKAFDDTFAHEVYVRYSYKVEDLLWGKKFDKMYHTNDEGIIVLELEKINDMHQEELNMDWGDLGGHNPLPSMNGTGTVSQPTS